MTPNPYAPPVSAAQDLRDERAVPALWNPNAAAAWSLLLTPSFGAWLQMLNWRALGDPGKAAASRNWAVANLVIAVGFAVAVTLAPDSDGLLGFTRVCNISILAAWYYFSGRKQVQYVRDQAGTTYPRRGWAKPLIVSLGVFLGMVVIALVALLVSAIAKQGN